MTSRFLAGAITAVGLSLAGQAGAAVTYAGTSGVGATVFNNCTGCHNSNLGAGSRSSAPLGVDYNTHAVATSGTNAARAKVRS